MNKALKAIYNWLGWSGALRNEPGRQISAPSGQLVDGVAHIGPDQALQISTVWSCVSRRASTIASLPLFVYRNRDGMRDLDRGSRVWQVLHDTPNRRMTPFEFWQAMMLNHDLRGNAYARIERDMRTGEAIALWPMPADQIEVELMEDGSVVYLYRLKGNIIALAEDNVLHIKEIGNGTIGLSRLDYMRSTTTEAQKANQEAIQTFGNSGKPTGVLMLDKVLSKEQRAQLQARFAEMASGSVSRLYVLEAAMKYEKLSLSPEQQQLLESRKFGVEEICRWFDVPPVLAHHSNVTTWGSGIEQIVDGFHKFTIRPLAVSIEQALTKRVLTPSQRATLTVEFSLDALLRASLKDRMEIYAKAVQNGIYNRNEARQLENAPPYKGGEMFTAQTNLAPIDMLGRIKVPAGMPSEPTAQ